MKIKENKLIGIILIILTVALLIPSKVLAAGASISTSASTIKVGETATISINVSNVEVWEVKLSSSGGTLSTTSGISPVNYIFIDCVPNICQPFQQLKQELILFHILEQ